MTATMPDETVPSGGDTPDTAPPTTSTTPLALVVSLGLGAVLVLIVVSLAFSTSNTPSSMDGTSVTSSQFFPDGTP